MKYGVFNDELNIVEYHEQEPNTETFIAMSDRLWELLIENYPNPMIKKETFVKKSFYDEKDFDMFYHKEALVKTMEITEDTLLSRMTRKQLIELIKETVNEMNK